ncbi:MAG: efflux RND transporter permease subunit [Kofleriaceae bacterium]
MASVTVVGSFQREMTVAVRPRDLAATSLGIAQVAQALAQSLAAPVGAPDRALRQRTIRLRGRLETAADFRPAEVLAAGTSVVRLGGVATVGPGAEDARSAALYDGHAAVAIDIKKAAGYSTTDVSAKIGAKLAELRAALVAKHADIRLEVVRDSGVRVDASVSGNQKLAHRGRAAHHLGGVRVPQVVAVDGDHRAGAAGVGDRVVHHGPGVRLHAQRDVAPGSVAGHRHPRRRRHRGAREHRAPHGARQDHVQAASGTSEIGLAVAATTFSIVVVFVPIAFMGGIAQQWFAPFALTIASSVLVSLFVSFSLDPMLSAVWADPEATGHKKTWLTRQLDYFDRGFVALTRFYKRVIRWALRHRLLMVIVMFFVLVGTAAIPATGLVGCAFMPVEDRSEFTIQLETPPGSNLDYTRGKVAEAVALVKRHPEVAYTYATVGGQGGTVDSASIYVRLTPKHARAVHQDVIAQQVRNEIRSLSGVTAYISTGGFGPAKQIQIELTGEDTAVLTDLAEQVAARVRTVPGAVDVGLSTKGQRPEVEVVLDRELAGTLGVSVAEVAQALRPAFTGLDVGDWIDASGRTRDVVVRLGADWRQRPEDLEALPLVLQGPTGPAMVPLGQVAKVNRSLGPALVEHKDGDRVITVGANTEGRPLSAVIGDIEAKLGSLQLPPGYQRRQGGEAADQAEVFTRIFIALGAAILLMYFILVIQFSSFLEPLPIMASLPLSLIGVMLAMLVTGSTLNLMSMIGVILLMGIVAKNAILLIDFAKQAEREGLSREEALVEAGGVRLRPIIMTSVAIIAGMLPIAIGSGEGGDFRAPLGRAVIGGVITSTVLTLLVIPTYYDILTRGRDRLIRWLRRKPAPVTPAPPAA